MICKKQIVVFCIAIFLLSVLFFLYDGQVSSFGYRLYIVICVGMISASLVSYEIKNSSILYKFIHLFFTINLIFFLFLKHDAGEYFFSEPTSIKIAYGLYALLLALIGYIAFKAEKKNNCKKECFENFFQSRAKDLERLKEYLLNDNLKSNRIGVVGEWGSGKTFLLKMLSEDDFIKDHYEILTIESLSLNVEQIQSYIITEIEKLFRRKRIYSKYSSDLNNLLKKEHWYTALLNFLLFKTASYSSSLEGMKSDLEKFDKKILLVIEDIDRLNEFNNVRLIFDIVEKLTTNTKKIKAVFLFSEKNLENVDKSLNHDYVEKYVPYLVNLSNMRMEEIIKILVQKKTNLKYSDLEFLFWDDIFVGFPRNFGEVRVKDVIGKMKVTYSIRKIEIFLEELVLYFKKLETMGHLDELKHKNAIITIFFLKHFYHEFYTRLNVYDSVIKQLKIQYADHEYTVLDLIEYQKEKPKEVDIRMIVADDTNNVILWIVKQFGYMLYVEDVKPLFGNVTPILTESVRNIQQKNYNEKIDRIVKNVICSGVGVDTNAQKCTNLLKIMVLDKAKDKRVKCFDDYDLYISKISNEEEGFHSVIHHIGINRWVDLFKAFRSVEITEGLFDKKNKTSHSTEHWIALIDLFIESSKILFVNDIVLEVFSYCNLENRKVFLRSIEWFCSMRVEQNYNNEKCFAVFLDKYISAIGSLGYAKINHSYLLSDFQSKTKGNITYKDSISDLKLFVLGPIIDYLEKQNKSTLINSVIRERNIVIKFVKKLEEMMEAPVPAQNVGRFEINTSISEHYINEKEMNRIRSLGLKGCMLKMEIEKSYNEGKLFPIEVDMLLSLQNGEKDGFLN